MCLSRFPHRPMITKTVKFMQYYHPTGKVFQYKTPAFNSLLIRLLFGCYSVVIRFQAPNNSRIKSLIAPLCMVRKPNWIINKPLLIFKFHACSLSSICWTGWNFSLGLRRLFYYFQRWTTANNLYYAISFNLATWLVRKIYPLFIQDLSNCFRDWPLCKF